MNIQHYILLYYNYDYPFRFIIFKNKKQYDKSFECFQYLLNGKTPKPLSTIDIKLQLGLIQEAKGDLNVWEILKHA